MYLGVGCEGWFFFLLVLYYILWELCNGKVLWYMVVLLYVLGIDLMMWDGLVNLLVIDCWVIVYDYCGYGSLEKVDGFYSMVDLVDDVVCLLWELDMGLVVWVGLFMGGMVG